MLFTQVEHDEHLLNGERFGGWKTEFWGFKVYEKDFILAVRFAECLKLSIF